MMRFFKNVSMFFVFLPFMVLAAEVWLKYPSNHGGSAFDYAETGFVALLVNVVYMFCSRRLAVCRILAIAFFFVLLYVCDRFNVLVQYEEWIARGMPDWGVLQK